MWNSNQLDQIVQADDLHIAPFREDSKTPGTPTWVWCVQVGGELYVRGYNGTASRWYEAAVKQRAGFIHAAGETLEVAFEPATRHVTEDIDKAYMAKYKNSPYLQPMVSKRARVASVRLIQKNVGKRGSV